MTNDKRLNERAKLLQAIAVQENLRGTIDDSIIEATLNALYRQLAELEAAELVKQRKQLTVLFMDVVSSTQMIRDLDPEDNMAIMDTALQLMAEPIKRFNGRITRYMGDGFKAVFGLPQAQENDPEMAVRAGLEIVAASRDYAAQVKKNWGIDSFKVRVGINTGLAVIGGELEGADSVVGSAVNLASRLENAAAPGTVLISQHTYQHIRGVFDLQPLTPIEVPGYGELVPVYRVVKAKERSFRSRSRGVEGVETRMVGRNKEMAMLREAYKKVIETGVGQVMTISGEAGIGKSRLLNEFENWVDLQSAEVILFRGRARLETERVPYSLIRDVFAFRFFIQDDDPVERVREKMLLGFQEFLGSSESTEMKAHIVGYVLGYDFRNSAHLRDLLDDPRQIHNRALTYLADFFRKVAADGPLLLLLEDLHWADNSSLDAFSRLTEALPRHPVLIIGASRPTLFERRPNWFASRSFHSQIDLQPLSKTDSRRLVDIVLQKVEHIPETLLELLVDNAEGNPFYAEELIKMLVVEKVIIKDEPWWSIQEEKLGQLQIPPTLTDVLQAQLDRLPDDERIVLQSASVVGRVFWDQVLAYIKKSTQPSHDNSKTIISLTALRQKELIYKNENSAFSNAQEFMFKHALLREVTYESVLKRVRRNYHRLVAEWLINLGGERSGELNGLIAGHLEQAGEGAEALGYLKKAGDQAAKAYANEDALDYYNRALIQTREEDFETRFEVMLARNFIYDLLGNRQLQGQDLPLLEELAVKIDSPPEEGALRLARIAQRQSKYFESIGNFPEAAAAAQKTVELAQQGKDVEIEAAGRIRWIVALWRQGHYEEAKELAIHTQRITKSRGVRLYEAHALLQIGNINWFHGQYEEATTHYELALDIYREINAIRGETACLMNLGLVQDGLGNNELATDYISQALEQFRFMGDIQGVAQASASLSRIAINEWRFQDSLEYLDDALPLIQEINDRNSEAMILMILGDNYRLLGQFPKAAQFYKRSGDIAREIGNRRSLSFALAELGWLRQIDGRDEEAQELIREALELSQELGIKTVKATVLEIYGSIMFSQDRLEKAESAYKEAQLLFEDAADSNRVLDAKAGLAGVLLVRGAVDEAYEQVVKIIKRLDNGDLLTGAKAPDQISLICIKILQANHDPRSEHILEMSYHNLLNHAAKLNDEESRQAFIENVPWRQELASLWQAQ